MPPPARHNFHSAYRPDIDGLRAVAILFVVIDHAFPSLLPGGFVGVDIFFVISGFLISSIIFRSLDDGDFSFPEFYSHRIKRIFPALLVILLAACVLGSTLLLPAEYDQLGKHIAASAGFIENVALWDEAGYFDVASELKPLMHLWSLAIEEQFYLIYPVFVWACWRLGARRLPTIILLATVSFAINVLRIGGHPVSTFFLPHTRLWELLAGGILAGLPAGTTGLAGLAWGLIGPRHPAAAGGLRNALALAGFLLVAAAACGINRDTPFPGVSALAPVLGAALIILAGPRAWLNHGILSARPLIFVGIISYPLYLWHWLVLSLITILTLQHPTAADQGMGVTLSFVLAWATWRFVERPIRGHRDAKGRIPWVLPVLMLGVGLTGAFSTASRYLAAADPGIAAAINARDAEWQGRLNAVRSPYCHMTTPDQTFAAYRRGLDACLRLDDHRANVLVLGDSHAADMWLALRSAYPEINFLQATGWGCAPIESAHPPGHRCGDLIRFIKREFRDLTKLDGVILTARWKGRFQAVADDIKWFKDLGVPVLIIGPAMEFKPDVYQLVGRYGRSDGLVGFVNQYHIPDRDQLDQELAAFAEKLGIKYISRIDIFCVHGRCPVFTESGALYYYDYGHFTESGGLEFGRKLRARYPDLLAVLGGRPAMPPGGGQTLQDILARPSPRGGGSVDEILRRNGKVAIAGWAADTDTGAPARYVIVFAGDSFVARVPTGIARPDVSAALSNPAVLMSGFAGEFDSGDAADAKAVRAFALQSDGRFFPLNCAPSTCGAP